MQLLFYGEARKYNALPIDNSKVPRLDVTLRPSLTVGRKKFTYFDGMTRIPEGTGPRKGGLVSLYVDDARVATAKIRRKMGFRISLDETFDIGSDAAEPVSEEYQVPFDFQTQTE